MGVIALAEKVVEVRVGWRKAFGFPVRWFYTELLFGGFVNRGGLFVDWKGKAGARRRVRRGLLVDWGGKAGLWGGGIGRVIVDGRGKTGLRGRVVGGLVVD